MSEFEKLILYCKAVEDWICNDELQEEIGFLSYVQDTYYALSDETRNAIET